jgi:hypothetical protein
MYPAQEKGPVSLAGRPTPNPLLSRNVRLAYSTIEALVQVYVPSFLIGAGSTAITLTVIWAVTLWVRS